MSDFENRLRSSLARHANEAPDGRALAERILAATQPDAPVRHRREWRTWALPLLSAGAVVAVAAAVVGLSSTHHVAAPPPRPPAVSSPAPVITSGASPPSASTPPGIRVGPVIDLSWTGATDVWALTAARVLHAVDGVHWTVLPKPPFLTTAAADCVAPCGVAHLRFASDKVGYAYGSNELWMTTDGGGTWKQQPGGAVTLETLDGNVIRISTTVPACGPPGCTYQAQTAAVGSTKWSAPTVLPSVGMTVGVSLVRSGHDAYVLVLGHPAGGAGSAESALFVSTDDGASWQPRGEPCMPRSYPSAALEIDSTALAAAENAVAVACTPRQQGTNTRSFVASSTDQGSTWQADGGTWFGSAPITLLAAADAQNICGYSDLLYCSHDGGGSWAKAGPAQVGWLGFQTATGGHAVSTDGRTLWTSTDAGRTWSPRPIG